MKFHQRVVADVWQEGERWVCDIVYFSFFILPVFRISLGSYTLEGLDRVLKESLDMYHFEGWRVVPDCSGRTDWEEFRLDIKLLGVAFRR